MNFHLHAISPHVSKILPSVFIASPEVLIAHIRQKLVQITNDTIIYTATFATVQGANTSPCPLPELKKFFETTSKPNPHHIFQIHYAVTQSAHIRCAPDGKLLPADGLQP